MEERARSLQLGNLGTQLSSIQKYLNGTTEPSRRFLAEAAHVLGVREAWLICNEGAPTEAAEIARVSASREKLVDNPVVEEVFRARLPWEWIGIAGKAQVWNLFTAVVTQRVRDLPDGGSGPQSKEKFNEFFRDAAETTARAVMAGSQAVDAELPLGSWVAASYVVQVCEGLCTLLYAEQDRTFSIMDDEQDVPPHPTEES